MASALVRYTFAWRLGSALPLAKAQTRECSRKRPMIDLTRMLSDTPGRPARKLQMPRTTMWISTPAWLAS